MTVRDKIKKFNWFLQERGVEAVKTMMYIFQNFNMLNCALFWMLMRWHENRQKCDNVKKLEIMKNWQISKQKKSEILWYQSQKTIISGLKLQLKINVK